MKTTIYIRFCIILSLSLFLLPNVFSLCTVTLDKSDYRPLETATATMLCDVANEKNVAYTLTWTNGTNTVETDTGTTPSTTSSPFFETYEIPASAIWTGASATLTGSNLEGADTFNVSGNSSNVLTINDAKFSPIALLSQQFSIDFEVRNSDGSEISGAECILFGTNQQEAPLQSCTGGITYAGRSVCGSFLDSQVFLEGENYIAKVRCNCGVGDHACFDENGLTIEKKSGINSFPFTISSWLKVNTITDTTNYIIDVDEEIRVCANVTNYRNYRVPLEIHYSYRCDVDINESTERIVINSYDEKRGISANTTQTQCARLDLINYPSLHDSVNVCYASTDVEVLSKDGEIILLTYPTISDDFNITSTNHIFKDFEGDTMIAISILLIGILFFIGYITTGLNTRGEDGNIVPLNTFIKTLLYGFIFFLSFVIIQISYGTALENSLGTAVTENLRTIYHFSLRIYIIIVFLFVFGYLINWLMKVMAKMSSKRVLK